MPSQTTPEGPSSAPKDSVAVSPQGGAGVDADGGSTARAGRQASVVAVAILFSKLAGLARQRVTAHYFGTSATAGVIAAAFRIGNVAQNLLGEGTLSASFIPIYARLRAAGKHDEARAFAQSALGLLIAAVVVLTGIGVACAPWLAMAVAGGFDDARLEQTTELTRLLFPMTGILVLCAWALGVLNAHRKFFLPYAAPVIWSATQIAALIYAASALHLTGLALARWLAYGALVGAGLELLLLFARARPLVKSLRPRFDHQDPNVRKAATRLPGVLIGRGVIQISGLVDTLLVSFVSVGANAVFGYAQMLYLLPMSILGTGEAAVALPAMASDAASNDPAVRNAKLRERIGAAMSRVSTLAIVAIVVLTLFGSELISVLLRTGRFDAGSTKAVAQALRIYGIALLGNASVRLFATTFFALGDTKTPARYAIIRVVSSTALALLLLKPLGLVGVVVGATVAAWVEALLLGAKLGRRIGGLGLSTVPWVKLLVATAVTASVPLGVRALLRPTTHGSPGAAPQSFAVSFLVLAVAGLVYAAAVVGLGLINPRSLRRRG